MRFTKMRCTLLCLVSLGLGQGFLQPKPSPSSRVLTSIKTPRFCYGAIRSFDPIWTSATRLASTFSSNEELKPGMAAIDAANPALYEKLSQLRQNPYFRLYSVDILASCEYIPQELFECYSETCEIYPVDEDEVSCVDEGCNLFRKFWWCGRRCGSRCITSDTYSLP